MRKKISPRALRAARYIELLAHLSNRKFPVVCSTPEDIERVLALRSACLVEAEIDPAEQLRTGERRIARAVVTAITPQGRNALATTTPASQAMWRTASTPPFLRA